MYLISDFNSFLRRCHSKIKYMTVHVTSMKHSIDAQGKNCCSVSSGVEGIGDVELVCFIKTFLCSVSSCLKFFPYGEESRGCEN